MVLLGGRAIPGWLVGSSEVQMDGVGEVGVSSCWVAMLVTDQHSEVLFGASQY